ncbi:MAG: nuclear transport factor 2 family protein [Gemmatimonadota bacterium]
MKTRRAILSALGLLSFAAPAQAQDANSLREAIEAHYAAINSDDTPTIVGQHSPDLTVFFWDGRILTTAADMDAAATQGVEPEVGDAEVFINDFSAQIHGDVGVATFYLVGSYEVGNEVTQGTFRVTAVWVYEDGTWTEIHHHESRLSAGPAG